MSELSHLISQLNNALLVQAPYLEHIRYPELLLSSLEELNNLIGNRGVKDSVATQVSYLIAIKDSHNTSLKEDHLMLNTILYGCPGVGKTLIGTKLAKIWYSLGFLDGSKKVDMLTSEEEREKEMKEVMDTFAKLREKKGLKDPEKEFDEISDMIRYGILATTLVSFALQFYKGYGVYGIVVVIVAFVFLFYVIGFDFLDSDNNNSNSNKELSEKKDVIIDLVTTEENEKDVEMPSEEEIISVVSRADFVEKYVGWSAKKTLKLLNANLGKVLFVDEAYSLVNNGLDSFGIEVLNTINLFLSEHPGEIIVIFAGYKDLMENGIFSFQPGLSRRFMWHFECEGYSHHELFKIFSLQLERSGWGLNDSRMTKQLFRKYKHAFPNFGGDTERLTFFAKLEHSRDYLSQYDTLTNKMLTPKHIRKGIRTLRKNNIKKHSSNTNPLSDMLEQYTNKNPFIH